MKLPRFALLAIMPYLALAGCARDTDAETKPQTPKPSQGPGSVVAELDGAPITFEEMEERAARRLYPLRQEEYDARRGAIEEIVYERLLQAEAKRRGLSVDALQKAEIDDKIAPATPAEVDSVFARASKAQLGGRTKEQVAPEIEKALRQQREVQRRTELRDRLLAGAKVSVTLAVPRVRLELPDSTPALGPADAPITLVEFSDYQCPFCHRAQGSVDEVLKRYPGKVRFVHQEYPLAQHPRAFAAAVAARCANEQGRFWDFHRSLMTEPGDFADADLGRRATQFGMDPSKLQACVASGRFDGDVNKAFQAGIAIGVNSTPTFFVNGRRLVGAVPFETLQAVIDEELAGPRGD